MRRKSTRNAAKTSTSPEKVVEPTTTTRRSRRHSKRRKRSSSKSSSEGSDDVSLKTVAQQMAEVPAEDVPNINLPGEEDAEQPIWKVKPSAAPSGEIQKLKICLTRPAPASPDKVEPTGRRLRNKSVSLVEEEITSSEEKTPRKAKHRSSPGVYVEEIEEHNDEPEDKKGKGKSKTKHKSKSEKTPKIQDVQDETESEISENVQVTPQSPQAAIDIRVDNESVPPIEHKTVDTDETETNSVLQTTNESCEVTSGSSDKIVADEAIQKEDDETTRGSDDVVKPESDISDSQVDVGFKGFDVSKENTDDQKEFIVEEEKAAQLENKSEKLEQDQQQEHIIDQKEEVTVPEKEIVQEKLEQDQQEHIIDQKEEVTVKEKGIDQKEEVTVQEKEIDQESVSSPVKLEVQNDKVEEKEIREIKEDSASPVTPEVLVQSGEDKDREMQEEISQESTSAKSLEKMEVEAEQPQTQSVENQISEEREEEIAVHNIPEPEQPQTEEANTSEVIESNNMQVDEVHQQPLRRESKAESSSSEEPELVEQKKEADEQLENQRSPVPNKDESSTRSITMEESQRSDEDSRSADVIIIDSSSTPQKEDSSFNLTQSFSPDVREIVEANKELQSMKDQIRELFPTPRSVKRKRRWGNSLVGLELLTPSLKKIDIDSIKLFCPDLQLLEETELRMDIREVRDRRKSLTEHKEKKSDRKVSIEHQSNEGEHKRLETQDSVNSSEMEEVNEPEVDNSNIIAMNRKISIVDDTASKLKPPPSPAKNPVSEVLYITNLVRPFTLKQLKELLERTGKLRENGFWTDRIKSKCYVYYETIEEAEATRNALHGVHWPIGNGKKLVIDYATPEDLEKARNPAPTPPVVPEEKAPEKENQVPPKKHKPEEPEKVIKERERHRSETHVREWDIGKEDLNKLRSRSREREGGRSERNDRRKHRRSPSPVEDFISRKQRKKEEDIPQKLMDDLFRKTKTTPSIYWLPLTPEEIATKQQQRLLRMAEHKRRMEESSRGRGDYGRGAPPYRRRYD